MSSLILVGSPASPPVFTNTTSGDFTFSGALFSTGNSRVYARLTVSAGTTGDGTPVTMICNTVPQAQGASLYNTTTGVCTFDRTGWWAVQACADVSSVVTGVHTSGNIIFSCSSATFRPYIGNPGAVQFAGNMTMVGTVYLRAVAADTCTISVSVGGGAANSVGINQFTTYFMAVFLG